MPYQHTEIREFKGLYLQANSFNVPDGALEMAENVMITNSSILTKSRGYYTWYRPVSGVLNNIFYYNGHLLAAYDNKISSFVEAGASPNEMGTETTAGGLPVDLSDRVARSFQSNGNFYFTSNAGVLKLTDYDSDVALAGAPAALDVAATFVTGKLAPWLKPGNMVAYRAVFGYTDENENLVLGEPSGVETVINHAQTGTFTVSGPSSGVWTLTVASTNHGFVTGQWLNFSNDSDDTTLPWEGNYQISVPNQNQFNFTVAVDPGTPPTSMTYGFAMPVRLEVSIPTELSTALPWVVQIYRTSQITEDADATLGDYELVEERAITPAEMAQHFLVVEDATEENLRGAELYTNENSREGELNANGRPPLCEDVASFKGYAIYAGTKTRHYLNLDVIDATDMVSGDFIELWAGAGSTRRYVGRYGIGNTSVKGTRNFGPTAGGKFLHAANHGFVVGDYVYISDIVSVGPTTPLAEGYYYISIASVSDFGIALTQGGATMQSYTIPDSFTIRGISDGTNPIFRISQDASAAVRLRDTATSLVRAINRDPLSPVYAQYISIGTDTPGHMRLTAKGFTPPIYVRANTDAAAKAFFPLLPSSFSSGTQVYSKNDDKPHMLFISKQNEPEAVPIINFIPVGAKNKRIVRVHALRDSLIILKEDGVFRLTGDSVASFSISTIDSTVCVVAGGSASVVNNQVVFFSNQGVGFVSETSVAIISTQIKDLIQPLLGQPNLAMVTAGVGYESEQLYFLTTSRPQNTEASVTYVYNGNTDAWSTITTCFRQGLMGSSDCLFLISLDNEILKERKKQTKLDYTGQHFPVTTTEISADNLEAMLSFDDVVTPQRGDVIVKDNVLYRIKGEPTYVDGIGWRVIFNTPTTFLEYDELFLYSSYTSRIKTAPFHAGMVSRAKQFSQFQLHMRNAASTRYMISFAGDTYASSESLIWEPDVDRAGWGNFPWGNEPWGQTDSIYLTQGTSPAPILRIEVPENQQRVTFLQTYIEHAEAAEAMNIQAIGYSIRAFGERVTDHDA